MVRRIPAGKVCTYGQVALMAGRPGGARQVGWALHGLPEGSDVPWHRVVSAGGKLGTQRLGWCAEMRQRALLEAEGIAFGNAGAVDLSLHQFNPE